MIWRIDTSYRTPVHDYTTYETRWCLYWRRHLNVCLHRYRFRGCERWHLTVTYDRH